MTHTATIDDLREELEARFGHQRFRALQRPIIQAMLERRDVLAVLPTGGGKSLCFQLPALATPGLTLVVSPLISLMEDQVMGLASRGIAAASLTSATSRVERRRAEALAISKSSGLLYVSPERLTSAGFRKLSAAARPVRLVVDEAHCISEWGHDFRPAYRHIASFARHVGRPPVAAFTATATPATRIDIGQCLELRKPFRVLSSVNRPNLSWHVFRSSTAEAAAHTSHEVRTVLRSHSRGAAVVYASTRARTVRLAEFLRRLGIPAEPYHAGMADDDRQRVQTSFVNGELRVVCATSAFGMGIDHPRIRLVVHLGMPASLEAYVQESGRAGRDGMPARCVLHATPDDRRIHRALIAESWPAAGRVEEAWRDVHAGRPVADDSAAVRVLLEHGSLRRHRSGRLTVLRPPRQTALRPVLRRGRRRARHRLDRVTRYVAATGCRRAVIARYFGERPPRCTGCDRCDGSGQP